MERFERYETMKKSEQMAEEYLTEDADVVLVAYGATSRVARSAVNTARAKGIKAGLIRPITLWPFPTEALNRAAAQRQGLPGGGDEHGPDGGRREAWPSTARCRSTSTAAPAA